MAQIIEANAARIESIRRARIAPTSSVWSSERGATGYAFNEGYSAPGMAAVAVPICASSGEPVGALCVAALATRLDAQRRATVVRWLAEERDQLTKPPRRGDERFERAADAPAAAALGSEGEHASEEWAAATT